MIGNTRKCFHSRYAHGEGHTTLCYTKDGKFIITCGNDSELRRWESNIDEDDNLLSVTLRESATCVVARDDVVYIGSGHYVEAYKYPELKFSEKQLQFSAAVTDVDISSDGKVLIAGACDMKIKMKNLVTSEIIELLDHSAPILKVVLNPDAKYMASSSCDGSVKVWDTSTGANVKTFKNILTKGNDFLTAESLGSPAWYEASGSYLGIIQHKKVCFYTINNWSFAFELIHENIKKDISVIAISQNKEHLCAGTIQGEIIIWDIQKRKMLKYYEDFDKIAITAMSWNPVKVEFAFCDRSGRIYILPIEKIFNNDDGKEIMEEELDGEDSRKASDNEDNENTISISMIKGSTLLTENDGSDNENDKESETGECYTNNKIKPFKTDLQPAFQPSSTPSHFEHGYMVWNSVGIVLSFNSDVESSIDVEFHDTMLHHAIHRRNQQEYTMASLSSKVLCLASSSLITCVHINGWDEKKEWSLGMPEEETIIAVTSSGNWICCATDLNQLRFMSHTGMQRQIISVPGPVVCINGHERLLIVVVHMGLGLPGCQNLAYRIFDVTDFFIKTIIPFQPLPLSPESKLKWAGFSDEGTPCIYDSAGILRLSRDFLNWEVACNIRQHCKNKCDNYFMIGVSERFQCTRCILCKGSWYPMTLPRPTVVEIPFKIPLCNSDDNKTTNEDIFWRHVFSLPVLVEASNENEEYNQALKDFEKNLKHSIIKLFAEALRNKADMRAVSLASLMSEGPLEMAMKLVQQNGRYLFDKLHNIIPKDWDEIRQGPTQNLNSSRYIGLMSNGNEDVSSNGIRNNKYSHKSQGDMFELSQPSPLNGSTLLAACREKDSSQELKSTSSTSANAAYVNPFKVQKKEEQGPKGLSFFNTVKQSSLKSTKPDTPYAEKVSKGNQGNLPKEKKNLAPKKMKFYDWFNSQKSALQEKYPDLSINELTKVAMKFYREEISTEKQKQKSSVSENNADIDQSPKSKRLKIQDEKTKVKASAADKLGAFNFIK